MSKRQSWKNPRRDLRSAFLGHGFTKYGWLYHFRYGMKPRIGTTPEVLVTAATIGTKKERLSFRNGVDDVMRQTVNPKAWAATFCLAATDPCVQIADYCAWAIQRKWEHKKDERSYDLIKDRITYEFDLWAHGTQHYY